MDILALADNLQTVVHDLLETFPGLEHLGSIVAHAFVRRVPGLDLTAPKSVVLERQAPWHRAAVESLGFTEESLWTAEQVHGNEVAEVPAHAAGRRILGVDGLFTAEPGHLLGIHVADCCAVYVVDPVRRVIGLVHSGKKGTELGITPRLIAAMANRFGSRPHDLVVQLSPCIRPPAYEVDFAAQIQLDCLATGVPAEQIHDPGTCTFLDPALYYSYRRELGKTGRLLALLGLRKQGPSPFSSAQPLAESTTSPSWPTPPKQGFHQ